MEISTNGIGYDYIYFSVKGKDVYSQMKFESGVHRVQRVPATESKGRIQTSTITVVVMPELDQVDVKVRPEDLRVDTFRASGKGGQGVNKIESAVRLVHLATGITAESQIEKSQVENKEIAMQLLLSKL
jgi:peptide chain release factor 1